MKISVDSKAVLQKLLDGLLGVVIGQVSPSYHSFGL
jgi:hypothetical protein